MLKEMKVISKRPVVFLFILFLLIMGIASGVATNIELISDQSAAGLIGANSDSLFSPLLLSLLKNTLLFCSCVLMAIWIPGIVFHGLITILNGFLIGFTVCAFLRYSIWPGLLCSIIGILIPECAVLYAFFPLSLYSLSEWRMRIRNYFVSKTVLSVSKEYWDTLRPCVFAMLLGVFSEGVISPLILRLLRL